MLGRLVTTGAVPFHLTAGSSYSQSDKPCSFLMFQWVLMVPSLWPRPP